MEQECCRKQAYLIMAHNQFEVLKVLIKQIDYIYHDIFIHIDQRVTGWDFKELTEIAEHSNVIILEDRKKINWGTFDQTQCELNLLKVAMQYDNYSYYHLMSGADLLIKSAEYVYQHFNHNYGIEYVQFIDKELSKEYLDRVRKYHFFIKKNPTFWNKILHKGLVLAQFAVDRTKRFNIKYQKGTNWFSITDKLAEYLINHENEIIQIFNHTLCGDEFFVQTMLINSPYKSNVSQPNFCDNYENILYEIDWKRGTPYEYTIKDYELLKNSDMFFARKFNWDKDYEIIIAIRDGITNVKY